MRVAAVNKKAFYDYFILEEFTAGIVLTGNEVKAVREGRINLKDSYVRIKNGQSFIVNVHISEYSKSSKIDDYNPRRVRKLLLHKKEINRLSVKTKEKGLSVVPIEVFFSKKGFAKAKIALVKGKKTYNKKEIIKKRDIERELKNEQK
ncbi:SsrA-binding protein SmpB [bacterium]